MSSPVLPDPAVAAAFSKLALPAARRHAFLCVGPDCCSGEAGLAAWNELKARVRDLPVLRSKAACLRICRGGPWLVVYPEGVWYGGVTAERIPRIVSEHIEGGRPVEEWVATRHPLP